MAVQTQTRLIPTRLLPVPGNRPDPRIVTELRVVAESGNGVPDLCRKLFSRLRKCGSEEELTENLLALQHLAFEGTDGGAPLLAAYLDVTTAGARLIPYVHAFSSTRRMRLLLTPERDRLDQMGKAWLNRARTIQEKASAFLRSHQQTVDSTADGLVGDLRTSLECLLAVVMNGGDLSEADRLLLVDLLTLETDAWQERVSRLAGIVNPYRAAAVSRVLPILSTADSSIRDLRQLIAWVESGQDQQAFSRNGFRALEVLENDEFQKIYKRLQADTRLKALAELHRGGRDNPLPTQVLAQAVARIWALQSRAQRMGLVESPTNLLASVAAAQQFTRNDTLAIPLDKEQEELLRLILQQEAEGVDDQEKQEGPLCWGLEGIVLKPGQLLIHLKQNGQLPPHWPQGMPTPGDEDPGIVLTQVHEAKKAAEESTADTEETEEKAKEEKSNAVIKQLVMSNITSSSTILGFLRNPKVVAIPGLVADVAQRTRNPQIIETIANDRTLYTGFANRDVPLVCLRSPCNVSPKMLRKFIHVKYVAKVDLKRMAQDKAGIRKEVLREIQFYLETLS